MRNYYFFNISRRQKSIKLLVFACKSFIALLFVLFIKSNLYAQSKSVSSELDFLDINLSQINFEAKQAFEKKKYKEASKKFLEILHYKPNDVPTLYNLATCYAHLKKPELAAKALLHALIDGGLNDISTLIADSTWNSIRNHDIFIPALDVANAIQRERGETFFASCNVFIKGRLRKPDNYDSTKAYPLLILLHGYGSNAESLMSIRDRMGATNFFVAAPQGPYPIKLLELNSPAYSWFYITQNKELWKRFDSAVISYILNVIDVIKEHHKISGIYILGHSQGGALAYMTGIKIPNMINGIICFGARNPIEVLNAAEIYNAKPKIPVFIGHGLSDPQVNIGEAIEAKNIFTKFGYNVTLETFSGGHWLDTSTLIEARRWIEGIEEIQLKK